MPVPAEYAAGYDFSDDCLGQLRKDEDGEITWYAVGLDGTMLGDVNNTVIQTSAGPVVVVERWGDGGSRADYQLMNLNLEPLLPEWAEYLYHSNYYTGRENCFFLRLPGEELAEFLPGELALLEFEPYEESRAELYRESWDLAEEEVVVVNGRALFGADAHSWEPEDLPLPVLEQVDWTIRSGGKTRQTRISVGRDPDYDTFAFYTEGQEELTDQLYEENWIALPGTVTDWPNSEPVDNPAGLIELAGEYCSAVGIDSGCMEVTEAVQGEFGVVLALNGGYKRTHEEAGEDSWAHAAVLWYPNREEPGRTGGYSISLNMPAPAPLWLGDMALWMYSRKRGHVSGDGSELGLMRGRRSTAGSRWPGPDVRPVQCKQKTSERFGGLFLQVRIPIRRAAPGRRRQIRGRWLRRHGAAAPAHCAVPG